MDLILPEKYKKEREEYKNFQTEKFKKDLDAFIEQNQDIQDPYFIIFKSQFDGQDPSKENQAFHISFKRPMFVRGTIVFWVDNSRGIAAHLWTVNHQKKISFNTKTAEKLKGILRAAA